VEFIEALDQGTGSWVAAHQGGWLRPVMVAVTFLGDRYLLGGLVAAALLGLLLAWLVWRPRYPRAVWRDRFRGGLFLLAAALASFAFVEGIKPVVKRPRPPTSTLTDVYHSTSWSFPSGHAFSSAAIYGTLALLAAARLGRPWPQRAVVAGALALVFLIGVSRVYLGAHYVTDVLGGWAGGLGCALVCSWLDQLWSVDDAKPPEVAPEK
jgi:undecaprenyl-diphosphatase